MMIHEVSTEFNQSNEEVDEIDRKDVRIPIYLLMIIELFSAMWSSIILGD